MGFSLQKNFRNYVTNKDMLKNKSHPYFKKLGWEKLL